MPAVPAWAWATPYATLDEARWYLHLGDASTDDRVMMLLAAVSAGIEACTGHHFWARERAIRYATASYDRTRARGDDGYTGHVGVRDLLSVTELAVDEDGARTYGTLWSASDYDLLPRGNPDLRPVPRPYREIRPSPNGSYLLPERLRDAVRITGRWGFYEVTVSMTTLAAPGMTDVATTAVVAAAGIQVGHVLRIGTEQLLVTAVDADGVTLRVVRGVHDSTAAAHLAGVAVSVYQYPLVSEACLMQVSRLWGRRDTPFGVVGSAELGSYRIPWKLDADVARYLASVTTPVL